jgi:hypothetical protein
MTARMAARSTGQWDAPDDPLQALLLIETVREAEPLTITLVSQCSGGAVSPEEAMAARVKWARRARYIVLTRAVPQQFAPYNAIIRVLGTEDRRVDYLATLVPPDEPTEY